MRRWIIVALVIMALAATIRVGPQFGPLKPNPNLPTFSQVSGQSSKVTDYQPAYLQSHTDCAYPGYPDGALVVLVSAGRGLGISSTSLGGQDVSTTVVSLLIERGDTPLYVIGTASSAVLWRVTGATERVRHLVLASTHAFSSPDWGIKIPMGETGVTRDKVAFLPDTKCLLTFEKPSSADATYDMDRVKERVGRPPVVIAARHAVTRFSIPSGKLDATGLGDSERGRALEREHLLSFLNPDPLAGHPLDYDVAYTYPDGVIRIDTEDVVANVPVERYDTLPGSAGLRQLVARGALVQVGLNQYHIQQRLRMPAELTGTHFKLMKDVPRPDGKYDGACVAAAETGMPISSQNRTVWPAC